MTRDPRYDLLFEPVRIGPVTAKNRFFQVPHCTGMGHLRPHMVAELRRVKAEGGWGVVCTEYNSIHPSSDDLPHVSASLWNEDDVRAHRLMTDAVHEHGALAGAELWYGGARSPNLYSREVPMDVADLPNLAGHPHQARAMDRADIRNLRRWHREAALRARDAGFDIVYVYATHGYLLANFLDPRMNTRCDEYGGSLENRVRLVRELIEETREAVGDRCAVAVRFKADETIGDDGVPEWGERREMFALLAELPDLWDINIADYSLEMGASRFVKEAALEPYLTWVKSATTKPVVTVGRFTSPDTMVSQVRRGITDLIGAARPSIADPFLPKKIAEGRIEDIRECIGCNVCYSGDSLGVPIRCTQNPAVGEEWRRGWHPERMRLKGADKRVLIVGAGPAGMEAARGLGLRGYRVLLAEATQTLGGRVAREATLPGLQEYIRVRDYRDQQLLKLPTVEVYRDSRLGADDVFEIGADHVAIATGARWRRERFDGRVFVPVAAEGVALYTPDDIMDGRVPHGPVVVFDTDNYYMGGVIAERLCGAGLEVTYVTEADSVSDWAGHTAERWRIRTRLSRMGVRIITAHALTAFDGAQATLECEYTGARQVVEARSAVLVTQRAPCDGLYREILDRVSGHADQLPFSLRRVGDCESPAIIAAAVHAGHRYAAELDAPDSDPWPLRDDRPIVRAPRAASPPVDDPTYLPTLLRYYEEEIEGEAWFRALAMRFPDTRQKEKLLLLAEVERQAAEAARPLVLRYGLEATPRSKLEAVGRSEARTTTADWDGLVSHMRATFPVYTAEFEALERRAPAEDRPALRRMTAHEVATIDFLAREQAGDPDSTEPLLRFLLSPGEGAADATGGASACPDPGMPPTS